VAERPRIIVVDGQERAAAADLARGLPDRELVHRRDLAGALEQAREDGVQGVFLDTQAPDCRAQADRLVQSEHILDTLQDGVAIVDPSLTVLWCNAAFQHWFGGDAAGRPLPALLHCGDFLHAEHGPFAAARAGGVGTARLRCNRDRYLELRVTLAHGGTADQPRFVTQFHDVSDEERRRQKLDALHHAGRALTNLDADQLAEMGPEERVELLKHNLRQIIRDLLRYDVIEVRLLNRHTGELEPLLQEGMTPDAANRVLHARPEGNGVTGYVAATGKSYLCPDTTRDPRYLEGAPGAKSSLTVPLLIGDEVIGTFNVESPRPNAFTEEDLQFTELFGREVAQALHTLELLSAEKRSTASASLDAVSREVALPVDDILTAATALLARAEGQEPGAADKLKQILAAARTVKQSIQRIGESLAPAVVASGADSAAAARLKGLRVLVVDCDDRIRRSAHGLLGRFGCQVETAKTGQEALAMARVGAYDAVLVDIRLPDMGGYEAYRRLREAQPQARVVLMTSFGYDSSHAIVKARQEGLRYVLFKPFRTDQLVDALVGAPGSATPSAALRT
jgi:CheY-like chemotaxis protein/GAF domain-containing protein